MPTHIPTEVLETLIRFIFQQPANVISLHTILRVCKRWHDIGTRLIWTDIVLRNPKQIESFSKAPASPNLILVKTLTITFAPPEPRTRSGTVFRQLDEDKDLLEKYGNAATRELIQNLEELCEITPQMHHLSALSFQVGAIPGDLGPTGFHIPRQLLHCLVKNLPSSVRHLEIDTRGQESVTPEDESVHICAAIAARLRTLDSVHLRLSRFCPQLVVRSESLKSLVINTIDIDGMTKAYKCTEPTNPDPTESFEDRQARGQRTCRELAVAGLAVLPQMPKLNEFLIIDAESYIDSPPFGVDRLHIRDIVQGRTTTFPTFSFSGLYPRGSSSVLRVLRQLPLGGVAIDIVGTIAEIQIASEGPEGPTWQTTSSGTRLPVSTLSTAEVLRHDWTDQMLWTNQDEIERLTRELHVPMWQMEAEAGRQLVQAVVQDGVVDLEPLIRDEYEKPANSDSEEEEEEDKNTFQRIQESEISCAAR